MSARVMAPGQATVIAVTSGKGGVGKTNVAVNVGVALARLGYRTGVVDADFALGNVDVLLGLSGEHHLGHVLAGQRTLRDVALAGPQGLQVFPATSGLQALAGLTRGQQATREIGVVVNGVTDAHDARLTFRQIDTASDRFLKRSLRYLGYVTRDPLMQDSIVQQRPVVDHNPQAPASRCFRVLASRLAGLAPGHGQPAQIGARPRGPVEEMPRCA